MGRLVKTIEEAALSEAGLWGNVPVTTTPRGLSVVGSFDASKLPAEKDGDADDLFYLVVAFMIENKQKHIFYPVRALNGKIVPCPDLTQLLQ